MNTKEAAEQLNGWEYSQEGSPELFAQMKADGLVAIFIASDDLMEFRGVINDEIGAYQGAEARLTPAGLLVNDCYDEDCPYFATLAATASVIEAKWDKHPDFSWVIETTIPHETFVVTEDGSGFCRGIVFALSDVK